MHYPDYRVGENYQGTPWVSAAQAMVYLTGAEPPESYREKQLVEEQYADGRANAASLEIALGCSSIVRESHRPVLAISIMQDAVINRIHPYTDKLTAARTPLQRDLTIQARLAELLENAVNSDGPAIAESRENLHNTIVQ